MHVVLAGGGTAGHIEPALALADALRRTDPGVGITALGTERGAETRLVPARGYELALIPPVPLPRRPTLELFAVPSRLLAAIRETAAILDRTNADVVAGFGGYVALPAYLAARRRHIPFVVHEANARPGLANRIGARFTPYVATATPDSSLAHAQYLGIPLRQQVATLDRAALRADARRQLGLNPDAPTLLVFGGSQGARRLNDAVVAAAAGLVARGVQILHATGPANETAVREATRALSSATVPYVVVGYLDHMERAYAAADLVVYRAGAMTCAELAAVGLPAVYVPLPHGNGEQRFNALPVVNAGGGLLVADAELTGDKLLDIAGALLTDPAALERMSAAAADFGRRDADVALAQLVRAAATRR